MVEVSSSSEDENEVEALKEATDNQFLNETLFQKSHKDDEEHISKSTVQAPRKASGRFIEETEQFNDFGATKTFKEFVAKKLTEFLERDTLEVTVKDNRLPKEIKKETDEPYGIKLLSSSSNILSVDENENQQNDSKKRKRKKCVKVNEDENIAKCQEVAVDAEWIISKRCINGWVEKSKGITFKYQKLNNGSLVEKSE
ncbi:uncharacterized protein LOC105704236 [Orussus abietinus]|uniref:uncharacterized protein LOC105704236 n=1 Tax=Orussus abietinus TaxID=222816 RepID=UPI00062505CE|nr:uncharacterized protein LOC105704236 [Orussus abietinus]